MEEEFVASSDDHIMLSQLHEVTQHLFMAMYYLPNGMELMISKV